MFMAIADREATNTQRQSAWHCHFRDRFDATAYKPFLTIRPNNANLSVSAFRAADTFPKDTILCSNE